VILRNLGLLFPSLLRHEPVVPLDQGIVLGEHGVNLVCESKESGVTVNFSTSAVSVLL
jgi:hypothetical protein